MADKPSRGLVIYGDGLARFIDPSSSHTHLHSFASLASCGFLSLPNSPPSERYPQKKWFSSAFQPLWCLRTPFVIITGMNSPVDWSEMERLFQPLPTPRTHIFPPSRDGIPPFVVVKTKVAESEDARLVREFSQLLDSDEYYMKMSDLQSQGKASVPTISERFMGVKAAVVTNNSNLKSFVGKLGFSVLQINDSVDHVASELLKMLGFQDGQTLDKSPFDLVFLHVGASEKEKVNDIKDVNALVGEIMKLAKPGSEISSRLHMSLVLSYGPVTEDDGSFLFVVPNSNNNSEFSSLFPRQSYTVKGSNLRENVRHHSPMLLAQWQSGVTRRDMVKTFSFQDFKEHGGILTIPADRFIQEVAFKLWKAPKYGA